MDCYSKHQSNTLLTATDSPQSEQSCTLTT